MTLNLETPVTIQMADARMLGIVCRPNMSTPIRPVGVLIILGGAQYRVGSHRQSVSLARRLAGEGFASLRFDFPGLGDSPGEPVEFDHNEAHIGAAIDQLLSSAPEVEQLVLWGLCDGASASLLYMQARSDARISGLALLNPWIASETAMARAQVKHYYGHRVLAADFWRKLLAGGVGWRAARELARQLQLMLKPASTSAACPRRMAMAWHGFGGHLLLMLSEHDLTAQAFEELIRNDAAWRAWDRVPGLTLQRLEGADHTCSTHHSQQAMERCVIEWMAKVGPP